MLHLILHGVVPLAVALAFYRPRWARAALVLVATMVVDVDHLLASPIYDPERCSIGFHPLHRAPAILAYVLAFAFAWGAARHATAPRLRAAASLAELAALGLLLHMALDGVDCLG